MIFVCILTVEKEYKIKIIPSLIDFEESRTLFSQKLK